MHEKNIENFQTFGLEIPQYQLEFQIHKMNKMSKQNLTLRQLHDADASSDLDRTI